MTLKLYGPEISTWAARVYLVARIKGLNLINTPLPGTDDPKTRNLMLERIAILRKNPAAKLPKVQVMATKEYLKINPMARIPTLEVDGKYLSESQTICEYLEDCYPQPALLPADPYDRARVRMLCRMCDLYVMPHILVAPDHIDPLFRDDDVVAHLQDALQKSLWEMEQVMGDGPWAYGSAMSLADCVMATIFTGSQMVLSYTGENLGLTAFDVDRPFRDNPKLAAWWNHIVEDQIIGAFVRNLKDLHYAGFDALMQSRSPSEWGIFWRARSARA